MLDKVRSRESLAGTPYSLFYRVADDDALTTGIVREMPLVMKSPLSTGSKDVYPVWTPRQYKETFRRLKKQYPDRSVLVEKYIDGPQYLVETLTESGNVHITAVVRQEITFTGRFIVTGYQMVTDTSGGLYDSLTAAVKFIIRTFGLTDGPCHLELRHSGGKWFLIEANPRIAGGAMNAFIETAFGFDLAKETLKLSLGLRPIIEIKHRKEVYLQYVVLRKGGVLHKVTGKNAARRCPGAERVFVKPKRGSVLVPPSSMGHRYAYVIATGASAAEARSNAKAAAGKIVFHLQ
jgi:biotin carboxylase